MRGRWSVVVPVREFQNDVGFCRRGLTEQTRGTSRSSTNFLMSAMDSRSCESTATACVLVSPLINNCIGCRHTDSQFRFFYCRKEVEVSCTFQLAWSQSRPAHGYNSMFGGIRSQPPLHFLAVSGRCGTSCTQLHQEQKWWNLHSVALCRAAFIKEKIIWVNWVRVGLPRNVVDTPREPRLVS